MTSKFYSVTVVTVATPLLIVAAYAMFKKPVHILTTVVLASAVVGAFFEQDEDGENLFSAIKRVLKR